MFPDNTATCHVLDNGLTVILDADSSAPVISTQAWVETGSIHEGDFMGAGISHLLEHMVFKGTKSFTGEELSETVQAAGGQWNAYTSFDRTVYYIDGPADSARTFLQAVLEMVFMPSFPEFEFEKEKDVIRREIDMGLDDPDNQSSRLLFSTALASDGRAQPVIGHLELFNKVTYEDMCAYHAARYTTTNTFLTISGDLEEEEMLETLKEMTKDIPRSFTKHAAVQSEPRQLGKRIRRDTFSIPVSKLALSWQVPTLDHPDAPALDLLSTILGGGRSSRLYQRLREKQNLCLHIGSWAWVTGMGPGLFAVSAEVPTEQRDDLQAAILTEIKNLLGDSLDEELSKAKRMALSAQFKTLTSASGRASDLGSNWHDARNLNYTKDYLTAVDKVTQADIRRVCETYLLDDSSLTITSLDPEDKKEKTTSNKKSQSSRDITSHTLSNGLTLHLCPDNRLPTVSLQGAMLAGMTSETPATAGISTFLANMLSKGTTSRSGEEIATALESLGASLKAGAGNNTASISASCLKPDLEAVLEIMGDTLANPAFHQSNIDFERQTQLAALQEENEDPASLAFRTLRSSIFDGKGYGLNPLGTEESLANIDRLGLTAHHALYYTASNTNLCIFGDIDPDATVTLAEKHLAQLKTGEKQSAALQPLGQPQEIHRTLDKQQAVLALGYPGAHIASPDIHALDLIHAWCADMAGPLFTRIREDLGLAYYCSATQFHGHTTGLFAFYLGTSPEQLELAKTELSNTIREIAEKGIPAKTLDSVKNSWLAKQSIANQSNAAMARLCAVDTALGFSPTHHREIAEKIKAITVEDTLKAAQAYFAQQQPTVVTVTP